MKPQPEALKQEVLAGLVERVTYHNAENGFCVLRAKAELLVALRPGGVAVLNADDPCFAELVERAGAARFPVQPQRSGASRR